MTHVIGHNAGGIYNVDSTLPSSSDSNVDTSISDAMGTGGGYFSDLSFGEDSQGGFNYSGLLSGLLNTGLQSYLTNQNLAATQNFGSQVTGMAGQLANQAATRGEFKPFTVTSDLATSATTPAIRSRRYFVWSRTYRIAYRCLRRHPRATSVV